MSEFCNDRDKLFGFFDRRAVQLDRTPSTNFDLQQHSKLMCRLILSILVIVISVIVLAMVVDQVSVDRLIALPPRQC